MTRGRLDGSLTVADASTEAVELIALLDGLVVQAYLPGSRLTPLQARTMLHRYVAATLVPTAAAR